MFKFQFNEIDKKISDLEKSIEHVIPDAELPEEHEHLKNMVDYISNIKYEMAWIKYNLKF